MASTDIQPYFLPEEPPRDDLPPGPWWKCPACGATLRLNEHHSGGRHVVLFINGKPRFYQDAVTGVKVDKR